MLGRDLLRTRQRAGVVEPLWLGQGPAVQDLAQQLLSLWRGSIGGSRNEIEDLLPPIIHSCRSQVMARGLNKLISDACTFDEGENLRERRSTAFDLCAQALRQGPAKSAGEHRQYLAQQLAPDPLLNSEDTLALYADLPQRARLQTAPEWSPQQLIDRYNLHLAQGLLLSANGVTVTLTDSDVGLRRRLLKALRWHRLLAEVSEDSDGALCLEISGPAAVLEQKARYGLQLACFLPHLCTAKQWRLTAEVVIGRAHERSSGTLVLDQRAPLSGHSHFLAYTPPEIANCASSWQEKLTGWQVSDETPLLPMARGDVAAPDFAFRHSASNRVFYLECLHRWHGAVLKRRLNQLAQGSAPQLLLAIDRALVRSGEGKELLAACDLDQRIMLFNDIPTLSAVKKLLKAQG